MKTYKNENIQKLIILEGSMQNGFQNRNQRIFYVGLHVSKLIFGIFQIFRFFIVNRVFEGLICDLLPI